MLYLLRDEQGKALVIAQAASKAEAEEFGRANLPSFSGEGLEIDAESRSRAEEFWGVLTVEVPRHIIRNKAVVAVKSAPAKPTILTTHVWVRGLELPPEVEEDDVLTPEDRRDLALDHIARTSDFIGRVEIRKWSRFQG